MVSFFAFLVFHGLVWSAFLVIAGVMLALRRRMREEGAAAVQMFSEDMLPLLLLFAVSLSGLLLTVSYTWLAGRAGQAPPAGPQWVRGLAPLEPHALAYDQPLCVSLDGFTLHAATRAGGLDATGREALLRHVLRRSIAQERLEQRPDGLVRITLKSGPFTAPVPDRGGR